MLAWTLSQHPALVSYGELFHPSFIGWDKGRAPLLARRKALDRLRHADPPRFLRAHVWRGHPPCVAAVGFKILYNQILPPESGALAAVLCGDPDLAIIHLARRSQLRAYISVVKSQRTGVFQKRIDGAEYVDRPVTLDPKSAMQYILIMRRWRAKVDEMFARHTMHHIEYGDMVSHWPEVRAGVFDYLQVPRIDVAPAAGRLSALSLRQSIENYDDVARILTDLGFADELVDDMPS